MHFSLTTTLYVLCACVTLYFSFNLTYSSSTFCMFFSLCCLYFDRVPMQVSALVDIRKRLNECLLSGVEKM